jgi:Fe-S-cluster containining protein
MAEPQWRFPQIEYACIRCGKSCGQWRIWVEPELVPALRSHRLSLELEVEGRSPLEESAEGAHLLHDSQGRCHFLGADALCELHRDTGWLGKPRACRQFPFFLYDTPSGVQVGLSFRCTAVKQAGSNGVAWDEHQQVLSSLWHSGHYPKVGYQAEPFGNLNLDWSTYLGWEARWLERLETMPLWQACQPELEAHLPYFWPEPLLDAHLAHLAAASRGFLEGLAWEQLEDFAHRHADQMGAVQHPEYQRYLSHVLERKTLWWGPSVLAQLSMVLVAERLLHHYTARLGPSEALDRVEGEWLAHRHDLSPLATAFAQRLLQPAGAN